jgi:hypothetical protein
MVLLMLAGSVPALRAQPAAGAPARLSPPAVRIQLVAVVTAQLAAFRAEDWPAAYACAARVFQGVMPLPQFRALITAKFPVVEKNTRAEFGLPRDNGTVAIVPVRVFGRGTSEAFNWLLVKEGSDWKITGVVPQSTAGGA